MKLVRKWMDMYAAYTDAGLASSTTPRIRGGAGVWTNT